ncbi:CD109 antigen-like [Lethenteron reissneri]|uniref:CD109 antigen-like n=1 Tax=Lethenteron reissneri TaxID=7753 RepID=UPI002AB71DD6|nr:CD109 antigen-like [Lethenteron reissneri]XP_061422474.1 CD109 antigen-like [Lethenteron reissneri]
MKLFILLLTATVAQSATYLATFPHWYGDARTRSDFAMGFSLLPGPGNETLVNVTFDIASRGIKKELDNLSVGTTTMVTFPTMLNSEWFMMNLVGKSENQELFNTSLYMYTGYYPSLNIIIQCDRYFYQPGQTVQCILFGVYGNRLPYFGRFNISLQSSVRDVKKTWQNVQGENGVVSLQYSLSETAPEGYWYLQVEAEEHATNGDWNAFEVRYYVDIVLIDVPRYFDLSGSDDLSGVISAWYQGKTFKGTATVTIGPYYNSNAWITKDVNVDGNGYFTFRRSELMQLFYANTSEIYISTISVVITDDATGMRKEKNTWVIFSKNRVEINFNGDWRFIPGINFKSNIRLYLVDGLPLTSKDRETKLTVSVKQYISCIEQMSCPGINNGSQILDQTDANYTVPTNGIVFIDVPTSKEANFLTLEARFGEVVVCNSISAWVSFQNGSFLHVTASETNVKVGSPVSFTLKSSDSSITKVSYQVVSIGQVLEADVARFPQFTLTPSSAWGPVVFIIVYYGTDDGYIVHESVQLRVQDLENKVEVKWSTTTAQPGTSVSLQVTASDPQSFIGVIAVPANLFRDYPSQFSFLLYQYQYYDYNYYWWWTSNIFEAAGLSYVTNGNMDYWNKPPVNNGKSRKLENRLLNDGLLDTWFWQNGVLGPDKTITFTATAPEINSHWIAVAFSISNTSGLSVDYTSTPFEVTSPLQVTINVPSVTFLGEEFIVEATVFNKQTQTAQVLAKLMENENFTILFQSNGLSPNERSLNVSGQNSATAFFPVSLNVDGKVSFAVVVSYQNVDYTVVGYTLVKYPGFPQTYSESALLSLYDNKNFTRSFVFNFPPNIVQGSSSAVLYIYGDIIGPSLTGLDQLIQMPYGCGEQNMINFAPGIYIRMYLDVSHQTTPDIAVKSLNYMNSGYERELMYRRSDGSFSAFGNSDQQGSTWLTAFVLRTFLQARSYILVDSNVIDTARNFLLNSLAPSGQFTEHGYVIHRELQGGSASHISLTAYTLLAFLEDSTNNNVNISSAIHFLEANVSGGGVAASLPLALTAYALSLANSSHADTALTLLNSRSTSIENGLKFWSDSASSQESYYWQPSAITIETTAYALLAHLHQNKIAEAVPIMNWLSQQRNHLGGYASTQDTIVALQALSEFAVWQFGKVSGSLTVSTALPSSPITVQLSGMNATDKRIVKISTSSNLNVTLSGTGRGQVIAQLNVFYNVRDSPVVRRARSAAPSPSYELDVYFKDTGVNGSIGEQVVLTACTRWMGQDASGMALMETNLLSGFLGDEKIALTDNLKLVETSPGKFHLYFVNLNENSTCVNITQYRVAPVAKTMEALVSISDYYEPRTRVEMQYKSVKLSNMTLQSFCGETCTFQSNVPAAAISTTAATQTTVKASGIMSGSGMNPFLCFLMPAAFCLSWMGL